MGQRHNARGLDLNRDFIKLEAPETRALVRFFNTWKPAPVHRHPHDQRLASPLHDHLRRAQEPGRRSPDHRVHAQRVLPRGHAALSRRRPACRRTTTATSIATTRSGRPIRPRGGTGTTYVGLRNRLAVLSEAYAYAPYKDRVLATRDFVRECLEQASARKDEISRLHRRRRPGRR